MAVYLVHQQLLPLARACEVMEDVLSVSMGEGTLCDLIGWCARNLAEVEQHILVWAAAWAASTQCAEPETAFGGTS
jgi:hypothetical protein